MNRAYSVLDVKSVDTEKRIIRGTATTPTPDRMGDIVEPLGVEFKNPMPLLWQHEADKPVGTVRFDKPTKAGITFEAHLAQIDEPGTLKDRIDEAWQSVKAGLVSAVSIGFRALEYAFIEGTGGIRFEKSEVMELSLVTIPANADATISQIKSIDTALRAATGISDGEGRPVPPGVTGKRPTKPVKLKAKEATTMKKTYTEQISAFEATRQAKSAEMDTIMEAASEKGETLDAEQKETYDTLTAEVKEIDEHLVRLRDAEKRAKAAATAVNGNTQAAGTESRGGAQTIKVLGPAAPKGSSFVRLLSAKFMAREYGGHPADIALSRGWGDEIANVLRLPRDIIEKAAVTGGSTTDSSWAGALVTYQNLQNEFIDLIRPRTIIGRIPGIRQVPFNIKVPRETGETTAYWVGQGSPKPVSKGALDTVTLDFNKVAGLTFLTKELLRFSAPSAEQMMINSLTKAIIKLTDNDFLDPSKAGTTGVQPASITNGATSITASGTSADAFRADFADLLAAYTMSNYTLDDLVIVMSQTQALRLALLRNDFGGREFPDLNKDGGFIEGVPVVTSENVAANGGSPADGRIIVALAANSILMADDGGVEVNVSTEASIQTDDAPDSPQTASTTFVSMFQTNQVAILCERFITWTKARTGAAVYITGGNYGN
ncbi:MULTISPECIES: phage major capsid protein [unclassified Mesorhizobium]|uniref:phage major capsid protein n=1 Tax=unclassified Mesorhizobium TaxID=325217 RepID=UPI000FDB663D|nr:MULTISPECIES: phage major capsid protein [unclassified Mesorhizobium]TGT76733.1 phage major capsid protein [Mesorhizobium sp. M2E.F.Ca.ET.166.01.1.1]TGW02845.1 phage major capsid protein [Mesorhizobium sp. M2E.F.Ca.ET.154.01.1.1]